jgi:hypothetical protein
MPLTIKFKTQQDRGAERLWLTDLTGEYVVVDNEGGYGIAGTPNTDLSQLCLVAIVQRNFSEGTQLLEPVGTLTSYSATALNTDSAVFELVYINDGWHSMNLVALPVSNNQIDDLEGNSLAVGDHYYLPADSSVYIKVSVPTPALDTVVEEADYASILDQVGIITTRCEDMFLSSLSIERENIYQSYRATRKGKCEPNSKFNDVRELTEDIISADLTFRSGLMVQAQDQVELVLDERNL